MTTEYTLLDLTEQYFKTLKVDKHFIEAVYRYQVGYLNRNEEHLNFFGSNLIGVHAISFRDSHTVQFFRDVLHLDYATFERDCRRLTTVDQKNKVSSDPFNLVLMYLIHRCLVSPYLNEAQRKRGSFDVALIFFMRCLAILQSRYFPWPADPKIAQAAYAELKKKFLIKKLGSWYKVVQYRAEKLTMKNGLHYAKLVAFNSDQEVVEIINDSQGRVRDLYKNYNAVFYEMHGNGTKVGVSSSTMIDVEGVEHVREKVKSVESYVGYLRNSVHDQPSFIRKDLIDVIVGINTNTSTRMLTNTLIWLSEHSNHQKWHTLIDEYLSLIVVHSFHLIQDSGIARIKDYPALLINLKNLYLSTRSNDPELLQIRKLGEQLIVAANGKINNSLMMATRTSTILYITLRALVASNH